MVAIREKYIKEFKEQEAQKLEDLKTDYEYGLISVKEIKQRIEEKKLIKEKKTIERRKARAKRNKEEKEWIQKSGWTPPPEHIKKLERYIETLGGNLELAVPHTPVFGAGRQGEHARSRHRGEMHLRLEIRQRIETARRFFKKLKLKLMRGKTR